MARHACLAAQLQPHLANLRAMHQSLVAHSSDERADTTEQPPKRLGNYRLHRQIGRGGMGVVYEATDETLGRRVALKALPFAALLDRKQIDRFHNEARAAAQLHHPHIVPVYAVGVDRGVHYYAMQFIEGGPLSAAIEQLAQLEQRETADDAAQTTAEAEAAVPETEIWGSQTPYQFRGPGDHCRQVARLGAELAEALACAHGLSIIHRDIKPSNLLLDETGKVWIADFGLARIPSDVAVTATGDVLGTVRYMSPEQAAGQNAFVDHRSDIYSLGITLYELLTLKPAFPTTSREEFMRQIATVEPIRPRRHNSQIPVDLETIILTASAKDPADRYATADEMAEDLQRFLDGRPTLAKRASLSERGFKWARRHRKLVSTAAALLLLATVSLATATWLISSAQRQTEIALGESQANYRRAQANFLAAREIVDKLGVQTSERLAAIPGTEQVRRDVLTHVKNYYDFFLTQSADENLAWERTVALSKSGTIAEQLGDTAAAARLYRQAITDLEELHQQQPQSTKVQRELANCLNNEAMLLARSGDSAAALDQLDVALATQEALLTAAPDDADIRQDVACIQSNRAFLLEQHRQHNASRQAYETAVGLFRQAIRAEESQTDAVPVELRRRLAVTLHNLAALLVADESDRAESLCGEAIAMQEALVREHPEVLAFRSDLGLSLDNLGGIQVRLDHRNAAQDAYARAIQLEDQLVAIAPDVPQYRQDLAISLNHLGQLQAAEHEYRVANISFERAIGLLTELVDWLPDDVAYRSSLGAALYNQGDVLLQLDRRDSARQAWEAGLAHQQAAVKRAPHNAQFKSFLTVQQSRFEDTFAEKAWD